MKAGLAIAITLLILGGALITAGLATGLATASLGSSAKDRVICTGTIEIDPFGLGNPSLESATCELAKCGLLSNPLSILGEEGKVRLSIDGRVQATTTFESTVGENVAYTLKSTCLENPQEYTINLYDDDNQIVDHTTGVLA